MVIFYSSIELPDDGFHICPPFSTRHIGEAQTESTEHDEVTCHAGKRTAMKCEEVERGHIILNLQGNQRLRASRFNVMCFFLGERGQFDFRWL